MTRETLEMLLLYRQKGSNDTLMDGVPNDRNFMY